MVRTEDVCGRKNHKIPAKNFTLDKVSLVVYILVG